jgi:hypothetical protein
VRLQGVPFFNTLTVGSLFLMGTHSLYCIYRLREENHHSLYAVLPLMLTVFGSYLGVLFELDLHAQPFAQLVKKIRTANVPLVNGLFLYSALRCCLSVDGVVLQGLAALVALVSVGVAFLAFCHGPDFDAQHKWLLLSIPVFQVLQGLIYLFSSLPHAQRNDFLVQVVFQLVSNVDVTATWLFHFLNVAGGQFYLFALLQSRTAVTVASLWDLPWQASPTTVAVVVATLAAFLTWARFVQPMLWSRFYLSFSFAVWNTVYSALLKLPCIYPKVIEDEYESLYHDQPPLRIVHYKQNHPLALEMQFTAMDRYPGSQLYFAKAIGVKFAFWLISLLDRIIPQARPSVHISDKPRCEGPFELFFPLREYAPPVTPSKVRAEHAAGQLLAYICQFGHATTMLQREGNSIVMDLDWMNAYPVKKGFHPYGGKAWFELNKDGYLRVTHVRGPARPGDRHPAKISIDSRGTGLSDFKKAQDLIAASTMAHCVIGKHCCGIHSYFNVIALALHNGFDTVPKAEAAAAFPGLTIHPIRLLLQLHFYNHSVLEESTTAHLLEETSVFPQIFAFTPRGLAGYYNRVFQEFTMAQDADFEGSRLPLWGEAADATSASIKQPGQYRTQLSWEKRYHEMWMRYATAIVNAVYADDTALRKDAQLKRFADELRVAMGGVVVQGAAAAVPVQLPARHQLDSRKSLARFIADAIFCITIRHEIYGRISTRYGDDYTIIQGQVPEDFGNPAVEDYHSLVYIALATSRPNYIKLKGTTLDEYVDFLDPLRKSSTDLHAKCVCAYQDVQRELLAIQETFTATAEQVRINTDYCRPLPEDLCIGAAY